MSDPVTKQELVDAGVDAGDLGKVMNDAAGLSPVNTRLGQSIKNIAKVIEEADAATAAATSYDDKGPWATLEDYVIKDLVQEAGITYVCAVPHTAGVFATDLAAGKWGIFQTQLPEKLLSEYADLAAAIAAIGVDEVVLKIDKDDVITGAVAWPANIVMRPIKGSTINGAFTLTLTDVAIDAGRWAVFGNTITVAGSVANAHVYPEWFNPTADEIADDTDEIQAAATLAGNTSILEFAHNKAYLCGELTLPSNPHIIGNGSSLTCPAAATSVNNWITASAPQAGGKIESLVFDYDTNANGRHIVGLGDNAAHWTIKDCAFLNMKNRGALRADYAIPIAGDGNILVEGCTFKDGDSGGAVNFYAYLPGMGISNIVIKDCNVDDCGGSLVYIAMINEDYDTTGRFGAFVDCKIINTRMTGNGTGTHGPIPTELWGHDNLIVSGCTIDNATRGVGFAYCRNVTISGNVISNQTIYAHEFGAVFGATISGNTIKDCASFVEDTSTAWSSDNITIVGNTVTGTGVGTYASNTWFIKTAGVINRANWHIVGNTFDTPTKIDGCLRVRETTDLVVENNTVLCANEDDGIQFCNVGDSVRAIVRGNKYTRTANFTASTPGYDNSPAVISCGDTSVDALIENNDMSMLGTLAGFGIRAIGQNAGASAMPRITIVRNRISGTWYTFIALNDSGSSLEISDNDTRNATTVSSEYSISGTTVHISRANEYDGTAAPTVGVFVKGDKVWNIAPATGNPNP